MVNLHVPRSIMTSIAINGVLGLGNLFAALYATIRIEDTLSSKEDEARYPSFFTSCTLVLGHLEVQ